MVRDLLFELPLGNDERLGSGARAGDSTDATAAYQGLRLQPFVR